MGRAASSGALTVLPGGLGAGGETTDQAQPLAVPVDPPAFVNDAGREHWHTIARTLDPGVLTPATAVALGLMCNALATYAEADQIVETSGVVITGPNDSLIENPALRIRNQADAIVSKWAGLLGMTVAGGKKTTPAAPHSGGRPHLVEQ